MSALKRQLGCVAVLIGGLLFTCIASATTIVMTFDQLNPNGEYVDNYYNGGCGGSYSGGSVTCGGPNYGVVWSNALAAGSPNGAYANVSGEPSSPNTMGTANTGATFMNVAAGFTTGFSFYYTSPDAAYGATITVWSEQNGTGTLLATLNPPMTGNSCGEKYYSCWDASGLTFSGTAYSVEISEDPNYGPAFDNVTLGSATPVHGVPEPAELGMFGLGVLLIGLFAGLRRRVG